MDWDWSGTKAAEAYWNRQLPLITHTEALIQNLGLDEVYRRTQGQDPEVHPRDFSRAVSTLPGTLQRLKNQTFDWSGSKAAEKFWKGNKASQQQGPLASALEQMLSSYLKGRKGEM